MLGSMLADFEAELMVTRAGERERLARERQVYGLAASQMMQEMKTEKVDSKADARASLVETILERAWKLVDGRKGEEISLDEARTIAQGEEPYLIS